MKVCLVNLPMDANYGGNLQRFALCTTLRRLGHEVKVLKYKKKETFLSKSLRAAKWLIKCIINKKITPFNVLSLTQFRQFNEYISYTERYKGGAIPQSIIDDNDAFIVGSDQVWRYDYTWFNLPLYSLASIPNDKLKIAYAASMGVTDGGFPSRELNQFLLDINRFDAISVREFGSARYISKQLKRDVQALVDPTFLLTKDDYQTMFNLKQSTDPYVLSYILDKNETLNFLCSKSSDFLNCKVVSLSIEKKYQMDSPEEWVNRFWNASFVVTDSFHGTVFSILFNKPFISVVNKKRGAERFLSLLTLFGLERRIYNENLNELIEDKINWLEVNNKLNQLRNEGIEYLDNSLK